MSKRARFFVVIIRRNGTRMEINTEFRSQSAAETVARNLITEHPDKYSDFMLFSMGG